MYIGKICRFPEVETMFLFPTIRRKIPPIIGFSNSFTRQIIGFSNSFARQNIGFSNTFLCEIIGFSNKNAKKMDGVLEWNGAFLGCISSRLNAFFFPQKERIGV